MQPFASSTLLQETPDTLYQQGLQCAVEHYDYQACIFLKKCLKLDPAHFYALIKLAEVYLRTNRPHLALTFYRKALKINPENAGILNEIGNCYRAEGNTEKAKTHYQKALKIEPARVGSLYNLVYINHYNLNSSVVQHLKKTSTSADYNVNDRALIHFALARVYEYNSDPVRAFHYYTEANALQFPLSGYNEADYFAFFDAVEQVFTPALFNRLKATSLHTAIKPVFVLGMPRSGTSLVEQILASHPEIYGAGEVTILTQIAERQFQQHVSVPFPHAMERIDSETLELLANTYFTQLSSYCPEGSHIIVDKMPNNFFLSG